MTSIEFNKLIDERIARAMANPRSEKSCCSKGCSQCCSEPLFVDEREMENMLEGLTPEQLQRIKDRTREWYDKVNGHLDINMPKSTYWLQLKAECPFLHNKLCSVYERRPMSCRMYLAIGNPKDCSLPMREHQKIAVFNPAHFVDIMDDWFMTTGHVKMDMLGVLLFEKFFGVQIESGSRKEHVIECPSNTDMQ